MKHLLLSLLIFASFSLFGQFRMVSNGIPTWTVVGASSYTATIDFQSDLTGMGFIPTAITPGYRIFTGTEQLYEVVSVANASFFGAELTVTAISNQYTTTTTAPSGQVIVFDPDGRETIPQSPYGSAGSNAQLQAAIDTYNSRQINSNTTENLVFGLNHTDAGSQGVPVGEKYKAALGNTMGIPWGVLITKTF